MAVVGHVVATDQRHRPRPRGQPIAHRLRQIMVDRPARRRDRASVDSAARQPVIALLGHGQRHDPRRGRGQRRRHRVRIVRRNQHLAHRADQPQPLALGVAGRDRVEPVLRCELLVDLPRAQRHTGDRPVAVARRHRIVGIDRLMRAVERADAQMHDPARLLGARIARLRHISRQRGAGGVRQPHSLYALRTSPSVSSCANSTASQSSMRCSATSRARNAQSTRRATSCRAGTDRNARVSSLKPTVL